MAIKFKDGFTREGYNDKAKPCPSKKCKGMVQPTGNANIGRCNKCKEEFAWGDLK